MKYTWWMCVLLAGCPVPNAAQFEDDLLAISPPQAEILDISDPDPCASTVVTGRINESLFFGRPLEVSLQLGDAEPVLVVALAGPEGAFEAQFDGLTLPDDAAEFEATTQVRWQFGEAWDSDTRRVTTVEVPTWFSDADGDGFGAGEPVRACEQGDRSTTNDDCEDGEATVYPGAEDIDHDGIDQDCDGAERCFIDSDGDGFHADVLQSFPIGECSAEPPSPGDCDDAADEVNPSAVELRDNPLDDDCDGLYDCSVDGDGDGFTVPMMGPTPCDGTASVQEDCDDTSVTVYPGAEEVDHDGIDQDCDGQESCYVDADVDGYHAGVIEMVVGVCTVPAPVEGDCNDEEAWISPDASEVANNEHDENCDGLYDCPIDFDGDGYTVPGEQAQPCSISATEPDCDDLSDATHPNAEEPADGIDNDCDGIVHCHEDQDGDGYASDTTTSRAGSSCPSPLELSQDCNDADATIFPACGTSVPECGPVSGTSVAVGGVYRQTATAEEAFENTAAHEIVICSDVAWSGSIERSTDLLIWSDSAQHQFSGSLDLSSDSGARAAVTLRNLRLLPGDGTQLSTEIVGGSVLTHEGVQLQLDSVHADCSSIQPANRVVRGGVVFAQDDLVITDSDFSNCEVDVEGGVIKSNAGLTIVTSNFSGNVAQTGGAISALNGPISVRDSMFSENQANITGGLHMFGLNTDLSAVLDNVEFSDNAGLDHAGALYIAAVPAHVASVEILGGLFTDNLGEASAIWLNARGTVAGTAVEFENNDSPVIENNEIFVGSLSGTASFDCGLTTACFVGGGSM